MNEVVIFFIGAFISNVIIISIIYHFSSEHYDFAYNSKKIYIIIYLVMVTGRSVLNFGGFPILNVASCIFFAFISSVIMFTSDKKKPSIRFFETVILVLILIICETIGVLLIKYMHPFYDNNVKLLYSCFNMLFSMTIVAFIYCMVISKIWCNKTETKIYFIPNTFFVNIVLALFSIVNVVLIYFLLPLMVTDLEKTILLISMLISIVVDIFLLYFIRYSSENEELKIKIELLEQQSKLQYNYYNSQVKKYEETKKIFHDMNKHIKILEQLYKADEQDSALEYTKEINLVLNPLISNQYTDQVILNILLNEKEKEAINKGIQVSFRIREVNLDFMKPIEITSVFGNLLENAIESCEKIVNKDKFILLELETFNDMIVVRLKNSCSKTNKWEDGRPISTKCKYGGIGIINIESIIKSYDGYVEMKEEIMYFTVIYFGIIQMQRYSELCWCISDKYIYLT